MRLPIAAVLMTCGLCLAQNALDKPLDRNLQKGSGGINPPGPNLQQELRLRNAIVTGNAPGGFSFRGDVGYRAPGEFFGSLGSNETFAFRRDSYYSGLGGMGIRGTDALQYQIAMTTGNTPPPGLAGFPTFMRSGADVTATSIQNREENRGLNQGIYQAKQDPTQPGSDLRGLSLMSIRSPSSFMANRGLEPVSLGQIPQRDGGVVGVSASPLRGLALDKLPRPGEDRARPEDAPKNPDKLDEQASATGAVEKTDSKLDTKIASSPGLTRSAYDDLMERIRGSGKVETGEPDRQSTAPEWQRQLDELRLQLGVEKPVKRGATRVAGGDKKDEKGDKGDAKPDEKPADDVRPETARRIRDASRDVERLAPEGYDAYASHMQAAQEHIAAGRFFYAEERFTAALGVKSGDPMAAIGRVHAQLGAGMFLSASINLRALFTEHPEVVGLKYKGDLMPSKERVATLIDRLNELIKVEDNRKRDSGLLLAYLAYQTGNEAAVRRGLEVLGTPEAGAGTDSLQRLASLLNKVWLAPKLESTPDPNK